MPAGRPRNHGKHVARAVDGLVGAMQGLLKSLGAIPIGGSPDLSPEFKQPRSGVAAAKVDGRAKGGPGPGKANPVHIAAQRATWSSYTPAQRKARVAAMLKGRGLKPKRR